MTACGRLPDGSAAVTIGPCVLEAAPGDAFGHRGGCSWESEDSWQPVPDLCPGCGKGEVEVRQDFLDGAGALTHVIATYRCHGCGSTGPAYPGGAR